MPGAAGMAPRRGRGDALQPKGRRYYWKSEYLPRVDDELLRLAIGQGARIASPHPSVLLFPLDGAIDACRTSIPRSAIATQRMR